MPGCAASMTLATMTPSLSCSAKIVTLSTAVSGSALSETTSMLTQPISSATAWKPSTVRSANDSVSEKMSNPKS